MNRRGIISGLFWLIWTARMACASGPVFVENMGQWAPQVAGRMALSSGFLYVTDHGLSLDLYQPADLEGWHEWLSAGRPDSSAETHMRRHAFRQVWLNSQTGDWSLQETEAGLCHFFLGQDAARYAQGARLGRRMLRRDLYTGTDLVLSVRQSLKYEFHLQPGADPGAIQWAYEGLDTLPDIVDGKLRIRTAAGTFYESRPVAWQESAAGRRYVEVEFARSGDIFTFRFPGGHNPKLPLIIDPELDFASWSGATGLNYGGIATAAQDGGLISASIALGSHHPVTVGAYQTTYNGGGSDLVLNKYSADGSTLLWSSYLGGTDGGEYPIHMLTVPAGDLYFMGVSQSSDYPTTAGVIAPFGLGADDLVLSRLSADGASLISSTYYGGLGTDGARAPDIFNSGERGEFLVDDQGFIFLVSSSNSLNYPATPGAFQVAMGGLQDAIVTKMLPDMSNVEWATRLGGDRIDLGYGIRLAADGSVYVCGGTFSQDFPTTPGTVQPAHAGNWDGFVVHLSADGSSMLQGTLFGSSTYDLMCMMDISLDGEIYLTGQTMTNSLPTTPGAISQFSAKNFIMKMPPDLSAITTMAGLGSGFFYPDLTPTAFRVDSCEHVYLAGWGARNAFGIREFPVTGNAIQDHTDPRNFWFGLLNEEMDTVLYGSWFGGGVSQEHSHGKNNYIDPEGVLYQAACTGCRLQTVAGVPDPANPLSAPSTVVHLSGYNDWPATPAAYQTQNLAMSCNTAVFKFDYQFFEVIADFEENSGPGICPGESVFFEDNSIGGIDYFWDFGDGATATGDTVTHTFIDAGTYPVQLIVIDTFRCIPVDTVVKDVIVHPFPGAHAGPDFDLCLGGVLNLQGSGNGTASWSPSDGLSSPSVLNPAASPDSSITYTLTMTSPFGCVDSDSVHVNVYLLDAGFQLGPDTVEVGETVIFGDESIGAGTYFYDFGDGNSSTQAFPTHSYTQDGTYIVWQYVDGAGGCRDSISREVVVDTRRRLFVPSAFSPNSDGLNDVFALSTQLIQALSIEVFDRYGKLIWSADNVNAVWDGEFDGQPLPEGVYTYKLTAEDSEGREIRKKGTITLIR